MVDLDQSFFKKDINWFIFKYLVMNDFFFALKIVYIYTFYGAPQAKHLLAPYFDLFNTDLLVNKKVLNFLELQKSHEIILATGTSEYIASKIVEKFDIFSGFIASSDSFNCVGINKLHKILEYTKGDAFFYIGDSLIDLPIWAASSKIGVVNPNKKLLNQIKKLNIEYIAIFDTNE